jgi:hypothetical protein
MRRAVIAKSDKAATRSQNGAQKDDGDILFRMPPRLSRGLSGGLPE